MTQKASIHPPPRKRYADSHWTRSPDRENALQAYFEQQRKAYSRVKNTFIIELLGNLHHQRFLDYGCGPGMFLCHAAKAGASLVVGVDIEPAVLSTARYFAEKQGVADKCTLLTPHQFHVFSIECSFDVILLKDVIEHVHNDQELLNSVSDTVSSGGILVVSTQNALSLNFLIEGTYQRIICRNKEWYGWDPTHLRFYTPKKLKKMLETAGFRCTAWRSIYLIPHRIPIPRSSPERFYRIESLTHIDRMLCRYFPWNRVGWNIIVQAVKS